MSEVPLTDLLLTRADLANSGGFGQGSQAARHCFGALSHLYPLYSQLRLPAPTHAFLYAPTYTFLYASLYTYTSLYPRMPSRTVPLLRMPSCTDLDKGLKQLGVASVRSHLCLPVQGFLAHTESSPRRTLQ